MNDVLNILDSLYGNSRVLSIVYIVGAILLFIFIFMLIATLRKTDNNETKIIEETNDIDKKEENITENNNIEPVNPFEEKNMYKMSEEKDEEDINEQSIFEKTTIIPLDEIETEDNEKYEVESKEDFINSLSNLDSEEDTTKEIPNGDNNIEASDKKTFESNAQFSSVFLNKEDTKEYDLDIPEEDNVDVNTKQDELKEKLESLKNKNNE